MDVGVLLAAGASKRFDHSLPKQLYSVGGKTLIGHGLAALAGLDEVIIVGTEAVASSVGRPVIPGGSSRLASIEAALDYLGDRPVDTLVIHDAARPFVTRSHVDALLTRPLYSQYYLPLVNGLVRKGTHEVADRAEYIELVTPVAADYRLFSAVFREHVTPAECEVLPILTRWKIPCRLVLGTVAMRKVTTLDDVLGF